MTVCPVTESGCPRNDSAVVRPCALRPVSPIAITPSTSTVVIQTARGRRAMNWPVRAQKPREVGSAVP